MNPPYFEKLKQNPELWDHFTRKEEYNSTYRDCYDRFPYYLSNTRNIFEPDVSRFLVDSGYKPQYPDGKNFAVCLTHDIDVVYRSIPERGYHLAKSLYNKDKLKFSETLKGIYDKKQPLCNFEEIMDLEEEYGATSTFFFLALKPGDQDYSYNIMDLKDDVRNIRGRGWEVGLHGGHEAYNSYEKICAEKKRLEDALGSKVVGYRNHYLRFQTPDTWEHLSRAGFVYDTTFGYADCVGFRNGMCHPFKPYNLNTKNYINIVEIPLVVMDATLFNQYMRLDLNMAINCLEKLIERISELNGVFTLLWHNSADIETYKLILECCYRYNGLMTSGENLVQCNSHLNF